MREARKKHEVILGDGGVVYDVFASGQVRILPSPHALPVTVRVFQIKAMNSISKDDKTRIMDAYDRLHGECG